MSKTVTTDRREFMRTTVRWSAAVALGALTGLALHRGRGKGVQCLLPCTACPLADACLNESGSAKSRKKKESVDEPRATTTFPH